MLSFSLWFFTLMSSFQMIVKNFGFINIKEK